jgi:hypothetical protein
MVYQGADGLVCALAPSDTVCAYSSGAICGYCPIELIPVRRPSSSDLSVQDPIFYFHGKRTRWLMLWA